MNEHTYPSWRSRQRVRLLTYRSQVRILRKELFPTVNSQHLLQTCGEKRVFFGSELPNTQPMIAQSKLVLVICAVEVVKLVLYFCVLSCRIGDCVLPKGLSRAWRSLLSVPTVTVSLGGSGGSFCIGEVQRSLPFHYGRTRSDRPVLFEGVPYASLKDDPFGVPFPIDYRQHGKAVNSPRFSSLSYFFGSSATCAVQSPKVFVLDSPLTWACLSCCLQNLNAVISGTPWSVCS